MIPAVSGTTFTYTATRTGDTTAASTIGLSFAGSSATAPGPAGADYTIASGTGANGGILNSTNTALMFQAGQATATFTVTTTPDAIYEGGTSGTPETVIATISVPSQSGTVNATGGTATANIQDDDTAPTLALSPAIPSRAEGNSGTTPFSFNVLRTGDAQATQTVQYAVTGSGANPTDASDFDPAYLTGTVTFNRGDTQQQIVIPAIGDTTFEPDETFTVTLSDPNFGTITTASQTGTIINDDPAPQQPTGPTIIPNDQGGNTITTADSSQITEAQGTSGIDQVNYSGPGTVTLPGNIENVVLTGAENSNVTGNALGNSVSGNAGNNSVSGGSGNDTVLGGDGSDLIYGNQDADLVYGNQGSDVLYGGQGADTAFGGQGDDRLFGNIGNDVVSGNLGNDIVYGNQGADIVYGNQGSDVLYGGMGDDVLYGGMGDDVLVGGVGNNILVGGVGADRYVFAANPAARDLVLGFNQGEGDRLSLGGQTYTTSTAQNGDALLTLSGGGTIDLAGIKAEQVNASFFAA